MPNKPWGCMGKIHALGTVGGEPAICLTYRGGESVWMFHDGKWLRHMLTDDIKTALSIFDEEDDA